VGLVVGKWARGGNSWKRRISSETGTIQDMDIQKRELWDRLENEPERAYRAFECFLRLPSGERTLLGAYRQHVGNPDAVKPSDTWSRWSSQFAWRERAAAYDDHLASLRRESYERAIEEEAERQAREVEKVRGRYNELMTMAYDRAMEWLENAQPSDFRAQDVMRIIGLHLDYLKAFEVDREPTGEDDWSEEDLAAGEQIVKDIEARRYLEHPDLGEEDWEGSEEGSGEDDSEESEGEEP
jgi:hypothetical protein